MTMLWQGGRLPCRRWRNPSSVAVVELVTRPMPNGAGSVLRLSERKPNRFRPCPTPRPSPRPKRRSKPVLLRFRSRTMKNPSLIVRQRLMPTYGCVRSVRCPTRSRNSTVRHVEPRFFDHLGPKKNSQLRSSLNELCCDRPCFQDSATAMPGRVCWERPSAGLP